MTERHTICCYLPCYVISNIVFRLEWECNGLLSLPILKILPHNFDTHAEISLFALKNKEKTRGIRKPGFN